MKKSILLTIPLLFLWGCGQPPRPMEQAPAPDEEQVSAPVPAVMDFQSLTPGYESVSLKDYAGQVVMLDFWATWSVPCRHAALELGALYMELKDEGFMALGMTVDRGAAAELSAKVQTLDLPYPCVQADDSVQKQFGGIRALPTRLLLDRTGHVIKTYEGAVRSDVLRDDIQQALAE